MPGYNKIGLTPTKELINPYKDVTLNELESPASYDSEGNLGFSYQFGSFYTEGGSQAGSEPYIDIFLFSVNPYKINSAEITATIWGEDTETNIKQYALIEHKVTWNTPNFTAPYEESFSQDTILHLKHPFVIEPPTIEIVDFYGGGNNIIGVKYDSNGSEVLEFRCKVLKGTKIKGIYEII